ncbi:hypothetical protein PHMEG_00011283 [Phytophthora megakarya]|uniref:RNase H type-1 domain-containing protein n=1 Tax=Phytophthora megakarya TaxID=4795 RepID=A0A225WBP0_9STRA|nr:hypothetical protein PHMEG_00011283 [Phytophthora megakarya]
MNNGVQAALDIGATDLVIVGDSRLAIHQSLGESLITQLNRHRELVARLKSVKYLHAVREYNASADSQVTEALENKVSSVLSTETRLAELRSLNRIQEIIYASITESSVDEPSVSIAQSQVQARHFRHMEPSQRSGTIPEPRQKYSSILFADETSVTDEEDATQREEANGVPTEDSVHPEAELSRVTVPNCGTPVSPMQKTWIH